MSYFDDASLVMIPSGYKTSKVYSVKPTDGTGDLTFTRSNDTATRVGPDGLIEKVRTNIVLQSEGFDTASWAKVNTTITANAGVAPNGTTTADKIVPTTTGTGRWVEQFRAITSSIPYTNSFFAKADGFSWAAIHHIDGSIGAWFNVSSGTIGTITAGNTAAIESVGNGWYRCSVAKTSGGATGYSVIQLADADNSSTATASGTNGLLIWGAQTETGDIATDYIATTSAAVSVGPVANVPRLDYLNSSCPRLLLEPQRTNLAQYSEQFDNAAWTKDGITITANATTSPDGYTNADKLVASASAGDKITYQVATVSSGAAYTASAYYKASEYTYAFMRLGGIIGNPYVIYSLSTQALVGSSAITSSSIISVGNGWYRITATATTTATVLAPNIMVIPSTGYTLGADNVPEFTGNGTSGGFAWGCQVEEGAYALSLIHI